MCWQCNFALLFKKLTRAKNNPLQEDLVDFEGSLLKSSAFSGVNSLRRSNGGRHSIHSLHFQPASSSAAGNNENLLQYNHSLSKLTNGLSRNVSAQSTYRRSCKFVCSCKYCVVLKYIHKCERRAKKGSC